MDFPELLTNLNCRTDYEIWCGQTIERLPKLWSTEMLPLKTILKITDELLTVRANLLLLMLTIKVACLSKVLKLFAH